MWGSAGLAHFDMKKYIYITILGLIMGLTIGSFVTYQITKPKPPEEKIKWASSSAVSEPIQREYNLMRNDEKLRELMQYDNGEFPITKEILEENKTYTKLRIHAKLHRRTSQRDLLVYHKYSSNWGLGVKVGVTTIGILGGIYLGWKGYKKFF